ncbi:MAG: acyltransferase domain-containing protein, partial [Acidobacteria bacterium]|nr:acyltransferase domain-containing protein [Acidobacteriota bacterium]
AVLDRCEEVFREERGTSLLDALFGSELTRLGSPEWSGPALYAVQCALTALWSGLGIRPQATTAHDAGKLAAAQAAGTLGLEDGLRLAAAEGAPPSAGSANWDLSGGSEFVIEIGPGAAGGFAAAVAEAYEAGLDINFEGLFAGETRRRISLPGYPFERRRYWIPASPSRVMKSG